MKVERLFFFGLMVLGGMMIVGAQVLHIFEPDSSLGIVLFGIGAVLYLLPIVVLVLAVCRSPREKK